MAADTLEYLAEEQMLVVRSVYNNYAEPKKEIFYYPIMRISATEAQGFKLGARLQQFESYVFQYAPGENVGEVEGRLRFHLAEGGETKAIKVIIEPVPLPKSARGNKGAVETR